MSNNLSIAIIASKIKLNRRKKINTDTVVLETWIKVLKNQINSLVDSCIDDKGILKIPDKKSIIDARKCLTKDYKHSLTKE